MEQKLDGLRQPKDPVPKENSLVCHHRRVDYYILNLRCDFRYYTTNAGG
jgi:hypothetical protein